MSDRPFASRPVARVELGILLGLLLLAAITRLPGLDQRGRWDADQGQDMLVLNALVTQGEVPLLGPKTSIGTFHHGAAYYYILAPAAFLSGSDPVAVTTEIALIGIAAVAAVWWLARLVGGPLAAATAGLLAAISPAGIDESVFIWNPNLIPLFAALAFGGAIRARQTGRTRWWLVAGVGAMVTMQLHVLGIVVAVPLMVAWVLELRERRRSGQALAPALLGGAAAVAIVAAGYLPLLGHELGHDAAEARAIIAYVAGGGREASSDLATRLTMVGLRSITWPVAGLITDRVAASLLSAIAVITLIGVAVLRRRPADARPDGSPGASAEEGTDIAAARWLAGSLLWSIAALAIFAPSLATVTNGLPNDHYHAFLDPVVLALAGTGIARLWLGFGRAGEASRGRIAGRIAAGAAMVILVVSAVPAWPPPHAADGGWRGAEAAAATVAKATAGRSLAVDGIPPFKSANALVFPLVRGGAAIVPGEAAPPVVVLVCDPLFDEVVGAPCGGPAEVAWFKEAGRPELRQVASFDAGPRRVITIYEAGAR